MTHLVEIIPLKYDEAECFCSCFICGKVVSENNLREKLCVFCTRHNLRSKLFLMVDFCCYDGPPDESPKARKTYAEHVAIGMNNPAFLYDPETVLWFVDIGRFSLESCLPTMHAMAQKIGSYDSMENISARLKSFLKSGDRIFKIAGKSYCNCNKVILS